MLLAIDTSTELAGLALYDGQVCAELCWVAGRQHSVQLLPQIERLLDLIGCSVDRLTAIAAARGPGSFTGVRVGLATAQGLSLSLGLPAYGVCSLDILAAGQAASPLPVRPLLDAGRGRFATALYLPRTTRLQRVGDLISIEFEQLPSLVDQPCLFCGDLKPTTRARLGEMLGERAMIASPALGLRRPALLAEIAWERDQRGERGDPADLQPVYVSR